jgi:hypothetical protein
MLVYYKFSLAIVGPHIFIARIRFTFILSLSFSQGNAKQIKAMGLSKLKAYHTLSPCRFASYINDSVSRKLALLRLTPFTTIMFILLTFMSIYFHFYLHFKHIISLKGEYPFVYIIIYTYINSEFCRKINRVWSSRIVSFNN